MFSVSIANNIGAGLKEAMMDGYSRHWIKILFNNPQTKGDRSMQVF